MGAKKAIAACALLATGVPSAAGQLFESDSKRFGNPKMNIVVREIERRPLASVVEIRIKDIGSSVGSSFFLLCSLRDLARIRGNYRYIVKVEERPTRGHMIVGFLSDRNSPLAQLGADFAALKPPADVIDLEQFAPVCDKMK